MKEFIVNFNYLFIGLTVFLFIAIIGYLKENKENKSTTAINNVKEDITVSAVSISELENSVDNLNA